MSAARAAIWEPSEAELTLLRAALWPGEEGLGAWQRWRRAGGELEVSAPGSYRLLPLVYSNLGRLLDEADPDRVALRDVYRHAWARNQTGLRVGREALAALAGAGVQTLVLKGAALVSSAYPDIGSRPMGDVDVAVPAETVGTAVAALRGAGFEPCADEPERVLEVRHSLGFAAGEGQEIDLHRCILWRPGLEREFWAAAVPLEVAGAETLGLCPADQVLHVCVHGAAWNPVPPIRWAADAHRVIVAAGERLDWDRLVANAERGRLLPPLRGALTYLREELRAPVPEEALTALAAKPVSRAEARAHAVLAQPPSVRRSLAMPWWFWDRYRAQSELEGRRPTPLGLLRYMQRFWDLRSAREVLAHSFARLTRERG
jgi:Uncharacterised nucleotidyltransferase